MRVLFVHQNFPAQFRPVAAVLAARAGTEVVAIGCTQAREIAGVRLIRYHLDLDSIYGTHAFARRLDAEARRAEQILYIGSDLIAEGFVPDLVFVHCGWGESLPLRALFPRARIVTYFEWFYRQGLDADFDPEWPGMGLDAQVMLRVKNAATLLALTEADVAVAPTEWQRSTFPDAFRDRIAVCHEGVDLDRVCPDPDARLALPDGSSVRAGDEVVTYVSRNLEPLRGFHQFMRSLPPVLRERPRARVIIVGGEQVGYGLAPPHGRTWKDIFLSEVGGALDLARVHFLGRVSYEIYLTVLRVSAAHVYLTYPFVLSWSMLEAMAAQCLVIGSTTEPVREVIDGSNGLLVDFFDAGELSRTIVRTLADPGRYVEQRRKARETVGARYDRARCLERLLTLADAADGIRRF